MVGRHGANNFAPEAFSWRPAAALIMSSYLQSRARL